MNLKLLATAAALLSIPLALAQTPQPFNTTVSFDTTYDNGNGSLTTVACSDGENGLITQGFMLFDQLPIFPNIGGAPAITGFNSPFCGSCWTLTFHNTSINVIAMDVATKGFNIALEAMNSLTHGAAEDLGRVNITAVQANQTLCEQGSFRKLKPVPIAPPPPPQF